VGGSARMAAWATRAAGWAHASGDTRAGVGAPHASPPPVQWLPIRFRLGRRMRRPYRARALPRIVAWTLRRRGAGELDRDGFGAFAGGHHAHAHRLPGRQVGQPEIAQHRDVQEYVLAAGIRRHEAVALERAEPLDDAVDGLGIGNVRGAGAWTAAGA